MKIEIRRREWRRAAVRLTRLGIHVRISDDRMDQCEIGKREGDLAYAYSENTRALRDGDYRVSLAGGRLFAHEIGVGEVLSYV